MTVPLITPVLLSGGSGTRLWPLSRKAYPKQLLALLSDQSMLIETAMRVADPARFHAPMVICNEDQRFIIAEQFRHAGRTAIGVQAPQSLIIEPVARNTAAAATVAALRLIASHGNGALMLLLPADHQISDVAAFHAAIARGVAAAEQGLIVTFGMAPDHPATGYGYIRQGGPIAGLTGVWAVAQFAEKPDLATAERYLASGGFAWNAGIFLMRTGTWMAEIARHQADLVEPVTAAIASGRADLDFFRLDETAFACAPAISIDYAVMERTRNAAVVPCEIGWSDIGSWSELWRLAPHRDGGDNVVSGDVLALDTARCLVRSEGPLLATLGVADLIIVATKDSVLVAHRDRAQDVGKLVAQLTGSGRGEVNTHPLVHRPWGTHETLDSGVRFHVKRITVKPGQRLTLQRHHHRAEHWVVVSGTARVIRDGETLIVTENQSVYLPVGSVHRLENPGQIPLALIEVQSGSYLGEDDIVRLEEG